MNADSDIQVWLETLARSKPPVIVPYVQSSTSRTLRYKVKTIKEGAQGRSVLGQGGTLDVVAGVPAALGRMSVSYGPEDECHIDLTLYEQNAVDRSFRFECPKS